MKRLFIFSFLFLSCNRVLQGDELTSADINRMEELHILDKGEKVLYFYSEFKKQNAGNFITDRRIGKYWIDPRNKQKDQSYFAFYSEIISLDTVFNAGLTYCPYIFIKKKDSTSFKICAGGNKEESRFFFKELIKRWKGDGI